MDLICSLLFMDRRRNRVLLLIVVLVVECVIVGKWDFILETQTGN